MRSAAVAALLLAVLGSTEGLSKGSVLRLERSTERVEPSKYLPVVMWHGMGDSCCDPHSMGAVQQAIEAALPGVFVHSIATGRGEELDIVSSYFGSVNEQVKTVCDELLGIPELNDGYVAVGFSQGGQFMRAVAQRCQHLGPPMHTLVTMGAQHQGIMDVPGCWQPGSGTNSTPSFYCRMMQGLIGRGAYNSWVQGHVVQAQYVKDPLRLEAYLSSSLFLADINNEVPARRQRRYKDNLASLHRLVLYQFDQDDMVVPKESSHFGLYNGSALLAMEDTALYQEDWIGLRLLRESGRLERKHAPGYHMQFSLAWFVEQVVMPYLAVPTAAPGTVAALDGSLRQ